MIIILFAFCPCFSCKPVRMLELVHVSIKSLSRMFLWSLSTSSQYQLQLKSNSIKQNLLDSIVRAEQARSRSRGESPICWTVAQKKRLFRLYLDMFNAKTFDEFAEESVPPERREAGMDHLSESGAVTPSPYVVDLDEPLDVFELAELGEV
mmetsp:Transcript_6013/g.18383  ORF Transcript_6013/g.18383 Transcript_6013/m.18383 type:complete len:151 (+) Transcript_6013:3-455(+)